MEITLNKLIFVFLMPLFIVAAGCNTVSGTLVGAGKDLQAAGRWMSPSESVSLK